MADKIIETGRGRFFSRALLALLLFIQSITHLFWLNIAAHSGQVAIPWMMNQGKSLFGDLWEQHAPGSTWIAAAAQRILPIEPIDVSRLLNLLLVLATTLLVYQLAKRLANHNEIAGLAAAVVWFWWEPVYGNILFYFDTLLGFCFLLVLVIWFSVPRQTLRWLFIVGLIMGCATLFKQHGWLAVILFGGWLLMVHRSARAVIGYVLGVLILPLGALALIAAQGNLDTYLYWNWLFNFSGLMDSVPLDGGLFRKLLLTNMAALPFLLLALRYREDESAAPRVEPRWILVILMWAAASVVLYPRFGEIHAMGQLPFTAVMSGIILSAISKAISGWRNARAAELTLGGLAGALLIGWLWTGAVTYIPLPIGPGKPLAYAEYERLSAEIRAKSQPGDTLFILPQTDSTPQLHPQTGLLPPGTWIKGWHWYFEAPGVLDRLLAEWEQNPPTWIVIFPDLVPSGEPGITQLLQVVEARYEQVGIVEDVFLHGDAVLWRVGG